jgi:hypothetical protein
MSALRWPAYTSTEIFEALRLALGVSPLAQPPEANWRVRRVEPEAELDDRQEVAC